MKIDNNEALSNRKSLKFTVVLLTILSTTISIIAPVIAQINRPSQDFFEQGREQIEREIKIMRSANTQQNPQPILHISPSPDEHQPSPSPSATPQSKPDPRLLQRSRRS